MKDASKARRRATARPSQARQKTTRPNTTPPKRNSKAVESEFHILIVDDDRDLASNLQEILAGEGYRATTAFTGQDALEFCTHKAFDLAIVDIKLPDTTGVNLVERMARLSPDIEAIFITGYASLDTAMQAASRRRSIGYQTKPLDMDAFLALIRQVRRRQRAEEAMLRSEEYFRSVIENAPDMFVILNSDGTVRYVSPASQRLHGYGPSEMVGTEGFGLVHPDDLPMAIDSFNEIIETPGHTLSREIRIRHKDGSWRYIELTARNLMENSAVAGIVLNYRDITQRRQAEEALRASEEKFRTIFENVNDGILQVDAAGTIVDMNTKLEDISGYSQDELLGKNFGELALMSSENAPHMVKQFQQAMKIGALPGRLEFQAIHKDGHPTTIDASFRLLTEGGKPAGVVAVVRDITERKRAEELLRESEEKYRILVDNTGTPITYLTLDGHVLLANKVSAANLGGEPSDFMGKPLAEILPEIAERTQKRISRIVESGTGHEFEDLVPLPAGERWFVSNFQPVMDANGDIFAVQIVSHDQTDRKLADQALRRSEEYHRALIENAPDMIVLANADGTLRYASPAIERVHGYTTEELIGTDGLAMLHPDDATRVAEAMGEAITTPGHTANMEVRVRIKDGSWHWVEITSTNLLGDPAVQGIVVNYRDISERKRTEDWTRRQRDLAQALSAINQLDKALALCISTAIEATGMDSGVAYMVDETAGNLEFIYSTGLSPECVETVTRYEADSPNARLIMAGQPTYATHQELGIPMDEARRLERLRALAVIPITHEGRVIACMNVASHSQAEIPVTSRNTLEAIAAQIGGSIARLKAEEELRRYRDQLEELVQERTLELTIANEALGEEIIERRRAEEALKESESRYRLLADNVTDVIWLRDLHLELRYISPSVTQMTGFSVQEAMAQTIQESVTPAAHDAMLQVLAEELARESAEVKETARSRTVEVELHHKNGSTVCTEVHMSFLRDQTGQAVGIIGTTRDISERKQAEEALRREKEKFQVLAEKSPLALAIIDKDGRYTYLNPEFGEVFGYTLDDIPTGKEWFAQAYPDEELRSRVIHLWVADLNHKGIGASPPREFPVTCKDGSVKEIRFLPVAMETGQQFVISEDITERKQAEQALRHRVQFEQLITGLSTSFINLPIDEVDAGIDEALRTAGEFAAADRCYVCLSSEDTSQMSNTHEWCAEGIEPQIQNLQNLRVSAVPWWMAKLHRFENIHVPRVSDLPPEAEVEKRVLQALGVQSTIIVPMIAGGSLMGFLGFDSVGTERSWSEDDIVLLRLVGEICANALTRKQAEEALRESEERFRTIFENANDEIVYLDKNGIVIDVNRKVEDIFGYTPEEAIGRHVADIGVFREQDTEALRQLFVAAASGSPTHMMELQARRKDGSSLFLETSTNVIRKGGEFEGILTIIRDITERRLAEKALRKSEEEFRRIFENASDTIAYMDESGMVIDVNGRLEEVFGYRPDEVIGRNFAEFPILDPAPMAEIVEQFKKIVDSETTELASFEARRKDGSSVFIEASTRLIERASGAKGILAILRDISERKRAEQALRDSEEQYRALVENINDVIFSLDTAGYFTYVSPVIERLGGYTVSEVIGKPFMKFVHSDDLPGLKDSLQRTLAGSLQPYEFRVKNKSGGIHHVRTSSRLVMENGEVVGMTGVMADITERKRAQELFTTLAVDSQIATYIVQRGRFVFTNPALHRDLGYEEGELLGVPALNIVHPDDRDKVRASAVRMLKGETSSGHEFRVIAKDGAIRWAYEKVAGIEYNGRPATLASYMDMTDQKHGQEALAESEEKWRSLSENAPNIILTVNTSGTVLFINRTVPGITKEDAIGKRIHHFVHPDYHDLAMQTMNQVVATGKPKSYECIGVGPHGHDSWYETQIGPIKRGSRVVALTFISTDITQRKHADEALRESEQRYRTIVENASDAIIYMSRSGKVLDINEKAEEIFGYTRAEALGKNLSDFQVLNPENLQEVFEFLQTGPRDTSPYPAEVQARCKDGTTRFIDASTSFIYSEDEPVAILTIARDVTERKRQQEKILQRNRELDALNAIAHTVSQSLDLDDILDNALSKIEEMLSIKYIIVALAEDDSDQLTLKAHRGVRADLIPNWRIGEGVLGHVAQTGEPMFVDTIPDPEGLMSEAGVQAAQASRVSSIMYVPLKARGRTLGVMASVTQDDKLFSAEERDLLVTIGHQMSTAIENAMLYRELQRREEIRRDGLRKAILAQEDERRRIARELHDETSQVLTGASAMIEASAAALPQEYDHVRDTLTEARLSLTHMLFDVRNIIYELRPTMLDDLGLVAAARWHTEEFLGRAGVKAHFETRGRKKKLTPQVETALFRIIQEATTNIVKHAKAKNVTIALEYHKDSLTLTIEDDGRGFDLQKTMNLRHGKRGLGLVSMKERTEILNGTFTIDSRLDTGTQTTIQIPVK